MGKETGIAWTNHTFNPWWGCLKVSPGCEHCYAEHLAVVRRKLPVWGPAATTERRRTESPWKDLPKWNAAAGRDGARRRVFVASMADIFEDHPMVTTWRVEALRLLERCTNLDVQLLTKRPQNILQMVPVEWLTAWPSHVWVGTTVENQRRAEERIPLLLQVPARVRFLSAEPLLECVTLSDLVTREAIIKPLAGVQWVPMDGGGCTNRPCNSISWVIVGGESGHEARPFNVAWARSIVAQCRASSVPVFVKQLGSNPWRMQGEKPYDGPTPFKLKDRSGADQSEWPEDLRVQEFPR